MPKPKALPDESPLFRVIRTKGSDELVMPEVLLMRSLFFMLLRKKQRQMPKPKALSVRSLFLCYCAKSSDEQIMPEALFHGNRFRQIPWLVHVAAPKHGNMIG